MDLELDGKTVVITGGTRGIGYACAESFLAEGAEVTLVGSDAERVTASSRRLADDFGAPVEGLCIDLAPTAAWRQLADRFDRSDIIVNNAGSIPGGTLDAIDDAAWRKAWDLKVYGYITAIRQALPLMLERQSGVIVNIIGMSGVTATYDYICGSTANAALISFTKSVGAYSSRHGVRVLGVNPGTTETDRMEPLLRARARARWGEEARWEELNAHLPFGRATRPKEIADLVTFLASPKASYMSGMVVNAAPG